MVEKLTTVSLGNRFTDIGVELLVFFDKTQSGLLDQLLGRSAVVLGDLQNPDFLFGCELNFHSFQR